MPSNSKYKLWKSQGLCPNCGKVSVSTTQICDRCKQERKLRNQRMRDARFLQAKIDGKVLCNTCTKEKLNDSYLQCETCRNRNAEWSIKNPDKVNSSMLKRRYGITHSEKLSMLESQQYKCAICATEIKINCHTDHDHSTGKIRGLLCGPCNKGLGLFKDDLTTLETAVNYLKSYS